MQLGIDSETGVLRSVLLCRPDNYQWIPTNDIARRTLQSQQPPAHAAFEHQYDELVSALEGAGVECRYLEPDPHLPYQVYTRDSSQMTPWGPAITQLERPQRRGEIAAILAFYRELAGDPWRIATAGMVEGGDIHIIRPGLLAIGHSGGRTDEAGARQFAGWFKEAGWQTRLVPFPEHFLHLDVIFSMVTDGLALACTDVLDDDFVDWLDSHGIRIIPVSYREAMMDMACNVLALGNDRVVSPAHSTRVNEAMRAEGVTVIDPDLRLFAHGGGSVHCMTMPLVRESLA